MTTFTMNINTDNDAFDRFNDELEVNIRKVASYVADGHTNGQVVDANGNICGRFDIESTPKRAVTVVDMRLFHEVTSRLEAWAESAERSVRTAMTEHDEDGYKSTAINYRAIVGMLDRAIN